MGISISCNPFNIDQVMKKKPPPVLSDEVTKKYEKILTSKDPKTHVSESIRGALSERVYISNANVEIFYFHSKNLYQIDQNHTSYLEENTPFREYIIMINTTDITDFYVIHHKSGIKMVSYALDFYNFFQILLRDDKENIFKITHIRQMFQNKDNKLIKLQCKYLEHQKDIKGFLSELNIPL